VILQPLHGVKPKSLCLFCFLRGPADYYSLPPLSDRVPAARCRQGDDTWRSNLYVYALPVLFRAHSGACSEMLTFITTADFESDNKASAAAKNPVSAATNMLFIEFPVFSSPSLKNAHMENYCILSLHFGTPRRWYSVASRGAMI
jgi:hypothetical protein